MNSVKRFREARTSISCRRLLVTLGCVDKFRILVEVVDLSTDFLFASQLLRSEMYAWLGWISITSGVLGIAFFYGTILAMKALYGDMEVLKIELYNLQLFRSKEKEKAKCIREIRDRNVDIDVFSCLISLFEDIPQITIACLVTSHR